MAIFLDKNENREKLPGKIIEKIKASITNELLSTYPNTAKFEKELGNLLNLSEEEIMITSGGDDAIRCFFDFLCFGKKNSAVISAITPLFPVYSSFLKQRSLCAKFIPLENLYAFNLNEIIKQAKNTDVLIIVSPNNPVGCAIEEKDLETVLKNIPETLVFLDSTYGEFAQINYLNLTQKYSNLIVLQSFSKFYSLAGLRIGFLAGNKKTISLIKRYRPPYPITNLSFEAAKILLEKKEKLKQNAQQLLSIKNQTRELLGKKGFCSLPSQANFIAVYDNEEKLLNALNKTSIKVRKLNDDYRLPGWIRITAGNSTDFSVLKQSLTDIKPDAVIFDMDGVLFSTQESYFKAIKETVKKFSGKSPSLKEIEDIKKQPGFNNDWKTTQKILKNYRLDIGIEQIKETFQEILLGENFNGTISSETLLINPSTLAYLQNMGIKLGIVTGRPEKEAIYSLKKFNLYNYFKSIITLDCVKKDKPDPEGLNLCKKELKCSNALYLGDTINDIFAALNARLVPIGITKDKSTKQKLLEAGAVTVLEQANQLARWLYE